MRSSRCASVAPVPTVLAPPGGVVVSTCRKSWIGSPTASAAHAHRRSSGMGKCIRPRPRMQIGSLDGQPALPSAWVWFTENRGTERSYGGENGKITALGSKRSSARRHGANGLRAWQWMVVTELSLPPFSQLKLDRNHGMIGIHQMTADATDSS